MSEIRTTADGFTNTNLVYDSPENRAYSLLTSSLKFNLKGNYLIYDLCECRNTVGDFTTVNLVYGSPKNQTYSLLTSSLKFNLKGSSIIL